MVLLDGKKVAADVKARLKKEVALLEKEGKKVGLAVVIVGDDPASKIYVRNKIAACAEVGILSLSYELPENATEEQIEELVLSLNKDDNVRGILVQLPLPKHINERKVLSLIDVNKDVDGFSAVQMGKLFLGERCLRSCTPAGVMEILHAYNIPIAGKYAVVVGRSNTVGKPMAQMLLRENATVTVCHSKTEDLAEITKKADILVVAIGKGKFITENMIKQDAVVIDVGMNRIDGVLCGDVDFENVAKKCSYITPVPGGVGPMTVAMLLSNTVQAAKENL